MSLSVSKQDSLPAGRFLSNACRTALAGALGFSLIFAAGTVPAHAQGPDTAVATEQPAPPDETTPPAPPPAPGLAQGPAELEDTPPAPGPTQQPPGDGLPTGTPAPGLSPAPTAEQSPPSKPGPVDLSTQKAGSQSPSKPPAPADPPADETPEAPAPLNTPGDDAAAAAEPAEALPAAPEGPVAPAEGGTPGAHMGQGLKLEEAAAGAPMMARAAPQAAAAQWTPGGVPGMDVSGWQASNNYTDSFVNWSSEWSKGARFVYVKATEGGNFIDRSRTSHLAGAAKVGMYHGAYHFALPGAGQATATAQADHFVRNGGMWKADGKTLPPLLDIENNPYGAQCYGLSQSAMVGWIKAFSSRVQAKTGRLPMIYTNYYWWVDCTGNSSAFKNQPLHIAAYTGGSAPWMPGGWNAYSMWQFSSTGPYGSMGDSNVWNGNAASLQKFATGTTVSRIGGKDRWEVSAAVSKSAFSPGVKTAYIASGAVYSDALSGSAAAGTTGSPVLLTAPDVLPYVIRDELTRLRPQRIVVLGGSASVSNSVMGLLKNYSPSVGRISGKDRYEVSAGVSRSTFNAGTTTAYIASGAVYTDALSGSALAGHQKGPVLLTAPNVLPDTIRTELRRLQPQRIVVLGGPASVSDDVLNLLKGYSGNVGRISGADRYEVSAGVARSGYWVGTKTVYIASGAVYSDALSGSAAAARIGSPVLLTSPDVLPNSVKAELRRIKPERIVILGGTGSVSGSVAWQLQNYER